MKKNHKTAQKNQSENQKKSENNKKKTHKLRNSPMKTKFHGKYRLIEQPQDEWENFLTAMETGWMTKTLAMKMGTKCISWFGIKFVDEDHIEIGVQNLLKQIIVRFKKTGEEVHHTAADGRRLISKLILDEKKESLTTISRFDEAEERKPKDISTIRVVRTCKDKKLYEMTECLREDGSRVAILNRTFEPFDKDK